VGTSTERTNSEVGPLYALELSETPGRESSGAFTRHEQ
jgi:hypothetical protein